MVAQLAAAGIGAAASLVGGLLDNKKNEKAANTAFRYQIDLNSQAFFQQQHLTGEQNRQVMMLNDRVDAFNRDVLANHNTSKSTQTDESFSSGSVDFKRLVADAEAAGFNPLTVLRAGGWAGYQTGASKTVSTLEQTMARDLMTYFAPPQAAQANHPGQAPVAQTTNAWGNAIQTGLGIWQQGNQDRLAQQRIDTERNVAAAQIANLGSSTALNNATAKYRLSPPSWTGSGVVRSSGGFGGAIKSNPASIAQGPPIEAGKREVTNPYPWGLEANPNYVDGEMWEARLGDWSAPVSLVINTTADAAWNAGRGIDWYKGHVANAGSYLKDLYDAQVKAWSN